MTWKWLSGERFYSSEFNSTSRNSSKQRTKALASVWTKLIIGKGFHMSLFYILPMALGIPWYMVLVGQYGDAL